MSPYLSSGPGLVIAHFLMPAMLAAYVVGLHRERQILMDATVFPKNSLRVGIVAFERLDTVNMSHHPLARAHLFQIDQRRRPALAALIFGQAPTANDDASRQRLPV